MLGSVAFKELEHHAPTNLGHIFLGEPERLKEESKENRNKTDKKKRSEAGRDGGRVREGEENSKNKHKSREIIIIIQQQTKQEDPRAPH